MSPVARLLLTALMTRFIASSLAAVAPVPTGVNKIKAVFLINFTKFVDWPPEAFAGPGSPIVIGVLGRDPFGSALDQAVAGETVNGRPIHIRRFMTVKEMEPCHILFISSSKEEDVPVLLRRESRSMVLTVGDIEGFAARGGVIQFKTKGGRVSFEINQSAAERAGLKISARLLSLASVVHSKSR